MERIDQIIRHPLYQSCLGEIARLEEQRIYCRHDIIHFLDVARIGYILNLEHKLNIKKEYIYAAALLHDIGRHQQYLHGIPHEQASGDIAVGILTESGFTQEEAEAVCLAIRNHRNKAIEQQDSLSGLLYRADKLSRGCFCCKSEASCSWSEEKKNLSLDY